MSKDGPNQGSDNNIDESMLFHLQNQIKTMRANQNIYEKKLNISISKIEEQLNIPILENSEDHNLDLLGRILRVGSKIKSLHDQIFDQIIDILKNGDKDYNFVQEILIDIKDKLKDKLSIPIKDVTTQETIQNIRQIAFSYQPDPEKLQKALIQSLGIHQDSESKFKYLQGRIMDLEQQINFYLENNRNTQNVSNENEIKNNQSDPLLQKKYTSLCKKFKDLEAKYKNLQVSSSKEKAEAIQTKKKFQIEIDSQKVSIENQNRNLNDIKSKLTKSESDLLKFKKAYLIQKKKYDNLADSLKCKPLKIIDEETMKKIKVIKLIGQGNQSKIMKVAEEEVMALKEFEEITEKNRNEFIEKLKKIHHEYEIINGLNHSNIIKTFGFYFGDNDEHKPSILLEFVPLNLNNVVKKMTEIERVTTIFEISTALKALHEAHLIHKNLKPENILISDDKHAKVSDFGFLKENTDDFGTQKFMAPELLNNFTNYTEKVDVYSFGVIVFFILTKGMYPKITIDDVRNGQKAPIPNNLNMVSKHLINLCWKTEPEERPSFSEIIEIIKNSNFMLIDGVEEKESQIKKFLGI